MTRLIWSGQADTPLDNVFSSALSSTPIPIPHSFPPDVVTHTHTHTYLCLVSYASLLFPTYRSSDGIVHYSFGVFPHFSLCVCCCPSLTCCIYCCFLPRVLCVCGWRIPTALFLDLPPGKWCVLFGAPTHAALCVSQPYSHCLLKAVLTCLYYCFSHSLCIKIIWALKTIPFYLPCMYLYDELSAAFGICPLTYMYPQTLYCDDVSRGSVVSQQYMNSNSVSI